VVVQWLAGPQTYTWRVSNANGMREVTMAASHLLLQAQTTWFAAGTTDNRIWQATGWTIYDITYGQGQTGLNTVTEDAEAPPGLPRLRAVLAEGDWATEPARRFLESRRRSDPRQVRELEIYQAAWYFWHQDPERGEAALWRLGLHSELVKQFERQGRWEKLERMAHDPQTLAAARVAAGWALAQRAERDAEGAAAAATALQALEDCPGDPAVAQLREQIWQSVRGRLEKTLSRGQYAASLKRWALRLNDQALLEAIAFELGKLQGLEQLTGKPESGSVNSLPIRLVNHPDGSVSVSFQGEAGVAYQIYYSDSPAASPEQMAWTLAVDNFVAESPSWQVWVDRGDTNRPAPGQVQQRYYRVVRKPPAGEPAPLPQPPTPSPSTFTGLSEPLRRRVTLEELAELGRLIAGGAQTEAALVKKLATTPLSVSKLLELARQEQMAGNPRAAQWLYEAILGPKAAQATAEQQAVAHLYLGNLHGHSQAGRYAEAIAHYLEAARLQPDSDLGWDGWIGAGIVHRLLENYAQARGCWAHVNGRGEAGSDAEFAQWLIGLSYHEEQNFGQSLIEFQKLAAGYIDRSWQADGLYGRGNALQELGRWEEAKAAYLQITELKNQLPGDTSLHARFALVAGWTRVPLAQIESRLNPEARHDD
jgi:tetratricopeptide (TPR) repeat protein